MSWTAPSSVHNPSTGAAPPASWGDAVNAAVEWVGQDRPACRVYNSANINQVYVSSAPAWQAVTFNSERYDTTNMHSVASNTSRITIAEAGLYAIGGCIEFAASATGRRDLQVWINGSSTNSIVATSETNLANNIVRLSVHCEYVLAVSDYIELMCYQDSGGTLVINNSGKYSPEFWCRWVGA